MTNKLAKTVSLDEAAKILHISKRKCAWMLQNGIIPCIDTGKQTRRYTILRKDVLECEKIIKSIEFPQRFSAAKGSVKRIILPKFKLKIIPHTLLKNGGTKMMYLL